MIRGKKGDLRSLVFLAGVGFFFVSALFLFTALINQKIFLGMASVDMIANTPAAAEIMSSGLEFYHQIDKIAIAFFFSVTFALIITSWFVAGNPIGMIAYFFGGIIVVLVSMFMSNLWVSIFQAATFNDVTGWFPFTNYLMENLAKFIGILWFIGLIVTFVKPALGDSDIKVGGGFQ